MYDCCVPSRQRLLRRLRHLLFGALKPTWPGPDSRPTRGFTFSLSAYRWEKDCRDSSDRRYEESNANGYRSLLPDRLPPAALRCCPGSRFTATARGVDPASGGFQSRDVPSRSFRRSRRCCRNAARSSGDMFCHFSRRLRRCSAGSCLNQRSRLLGREFLPAPESLSGPGTLFGRHLFPASGAFLQALLPLRRHAAPVFPERLQHGLFARAQRGPGNFLLCLDGGDQQHGKQHCHV